MMLQVIRLQADLSGLSRRGLHRRADLWPLPDEDEFGEMATALEAAGDPDFFRTAQPGPLAAALQRRNGAGAPEPAVEDGQAGDEPEGDEPAGDEQPAALAPYDDPPEAHYDAAPLDIARTGPDLQKGDDDAIDAERERLDLCPALRPRSDRSLLGGRNGAVGGKRGPPRGQSVRDRLPGHGAGRERRSGGP